MPDADVSNPEIEDSDEVILNSSSGSDELDDLPEIDDNSTKASYSSRQKAQEYLLLRHKAPESIINP